MTLGAPGTNMVNRIGIKNIANASTQSGLRMKITTTHPNDAFVRQDWIPIGSLRGGAETILDFYLVSRVRKADWADFGISVEIQDKDDKVVYKGIHRVPTRQL